MDRRGWSEPRSDAELSAQLHLFDVESGKRIDLVDGSARDRHDSDVHPGDWGFRETRAPAASQESSTTRATSHLFDLDEYFNQPTTLGCDSVP